MIWRSRPLRGALPAGTPQKTDEKFLLLFSKRSACSFLKKRTKKLFIRFISPRSGRGFTLIEILVVLVLLGLALGIVVGAMPRRGGGVDLAGAAGDLAGALRLARARAIAFGRPVQVAPTADGGGYAVDGQIRRLPPAIALALDGRAAIGFGPDGNATGGTLRLAGDGRVVLLRVDWLTGRVAIAEAR